MSGGVEGTVTREGFRTFKTWLARQIISATLGVEPDERQTDNITLWGVLVKVDSLGIGSLRSARTFIILSVPVVS